MAPTSFPFSVNSPIFESSAAIADRRMTSLVPSPPTASPAINEPTHDDASRSTAGVRSRAIARLPVARSVDAVESAIARITGRGVRLSEGGATENAGGARTPSINDVVTAMPSSSGGAAPAP